MLRGRGFENVYNLTGGIKAWQKEVAVGPETTGLHLFSAEVNAREAIITGFGLEMGLRDFYLSMQLKVSQDTTKALFGKLADVEIIHQERLVKLYSEVTGEAVTINEFAEKIAGPTMEGGITTEEYLQLYETDLDSEIEVFSLALAIEAQALDLYLRAAERSPQEGTRQVLYQIADEERSHIARLSEHIDQQLEMV
jgi:rubrerythrin